MEPIHYLRAFRRRWWVIALSVLVAGGAAFLTTADDPASGTSAAAVSSADLGYKATTVLWNPGAPVVGTGFVIPSMDTLAQLVRFPNVAVIAAKQLQSRDGPIELSTHVSAFADPTTGFLNVTGTSRNPKEAEAIADAFSQGLITYLGTLQTTQIDQREQLAREQIKALQKRHTDPIVIDPLRAALAQLEIARTAPIPLTVIQAPSAVEVSAPSAGGFQAPKGRTTRVLLASLFGLLAGIALALVLERFDTRIRSSRSAEEAFGLPVLAEIPTIRRRRRRGDVVTEGYPLSRAAGAFRLLQVGLARWTSAKGSEGATTILVTSPEARDGKTTVAANLAVAYAQGGSRVLVVSCDLRRPAIHSAFGVSLEPGLTDAFRAMNGTGSVADLDLGPYLEPCAVVRVAVLPSGVVPEHPAELLGSEKMTLLIERLKKITDVVILDSAPLVVATDVVPLVPEADGVVLVARAGKTRREIAASAASLVERMGAKQVGVVLNSAREFSIPLAKRGTYRPTRKMRKAAQQKPQPPVDEPWSPGPPAARETIKEQSPVRLPEAEPDQESDPSTEEPEVDRTTRVQASSSLGNLQQELREMRTQLEGLRVELPGEVAGP